MTVKKKVQRESDDDERVAKLEAITIQQQGRIEELEGDLVRIGRFWSERLGESDRVVFMEIVQKRQGPA